MSFPTGWHITCTENHWANEVTTLQYIDKILLPYVTKTRKEQNLPPNQCCIVIFDRFKAQCTATVFSPQRKQYTSGPGSTTLHRQTAAFRYSSKQACEGVFEWRIS